MARLTRLQFMDRIKACFESADRITRRFPNAYGRWLASLCLDQAARYAVRMYLAGRREREYRARQDAYLGCRIVWGSRGGGKTAAMQERMIRDGASHVVYRGSR